MDEQNNNGFGGRNVPGAQHGAQAPFPANAGNIPSGPQAIYDPRTGQYIIHDPEEEKKKRRRPLIIAIICAVAALVVGVCVWWFAAGGSDFFDDAAQGGQAPYKSEEEIVAELNRIVEEGMLNISIASVIEFENGTSPGVAYIENVPSNIYVLKVVITLDNNGEVVYQSGGIRPDSFIETITLSQDLPAGTYPATATFIAYDADTLEEVGQAAAKITIVVNS